MVQIGVLIMKSRYKWQLGDKVAVNSEPDGQVYTIVKIIHDFLVEIAYGDYKPNLIDMSYLRKPTKAQLSR